jgi:MerR family transcriptional regulator, heat shock protein HspR
MVIMPAERLDDPDYPAYTMGQAAEVLGVRQAFLRGLDAAGAIRAGRSSGGHRRYSRRQLVLAERIRQLFDQGHNLASTLRILALEDELAAARDLITRLRGGGGPHAGAGPGAQAGPAGQP